jgi:hypothetical protein
MLHTLMRTAAAVLVLAAPLPASASILDYRVIAVEETAVTLCEGDKTAYCLRLTDVAPQDQQAYCTDAQMRTAFISEWDEGSPDAGSSLRTASIGNITDLAASLDGRVGESIASSTFTCWNDEPNSRSLVLACIESRPGNVMDAPDWFFEACYRAWMTEEITP